MAITVASPEETTASPSGTGRYLAPSASGPPIDATAIPTRSGPGSARSPDDGLTSATGGGLAPASPAAAARGGALSGGRRGRRAAGGGLRGRRRRRGRATLTGGVAGA